ncbi:MAG: hypothetical protein AB1529_01205 [Candidatus Micrarchaeota archaeon]
MTRRLAAAFAVSAAVHVPLWGGYAYHNSPRVREYFDRTEKAAESAKFYWKRESLKREARAGKIGMGEFILRANEIDSEAGNLPFDYAKSEKAYSERLNNIRMLLALGAPLEDAVPAVLKDMNYHGAGGILMGTALIEKGGSCEQMSHLIAALAADSDHETSLRYYGPNSAGVSHITAIAKIGGREHDLMAGRDAVRKGSIFRAQELISMYDSGKGGFAYPEAKESYSEAPVPLFESKAVHPPGEGRDVDVRSERMQSDPLTTPPHEISGEAFHNFLAGKPLCGGNGNCSTLEGQLMRGPLNFDFLAGKDALLGLSSGKAVSFSIYDSGEAERFLPELSRIMLSVEAAIGKSTRKGERVVLYGTLAGLYNKSELLLAIAGKGSLSKHAASMKEKAIRDGEKELEGVTAREVLEALEQAEAGPMLDPRNVLFLGKKGRALALEIVRRHADAYARYLNAPIDARPNTTGQLLPPTVPMLSFLESETIRGDVHDILESHPDSRRLIITLVIATRYSPDDADCRRLLCKAGRAYHGFLSSRAASSSSFSDSTPLAGAFAAEGLGIEWQNEFMALWKRISVNYTTF